jgi:hypothetical protein
MPIYNFQSLPGTTPDSLKAELTSKISQLTPTQLFEELFTSDIFELLATETQRYAMHVWNYVDFVTSADEMRFPVFSCFRGTTSEAVKGLLQ